MKMVLKYWTLFLLGVVVCGANGEPGQEESGSGLKGDEPHGILLADDRVEPVLTIRWEAEDGPRTISRAVAYGPPMGGVVLLSGGGLENDGGEVDAELSDEQSNIRGYMALGGTRVDTGAGHPKGVVLRAGLTKVDSARPFFAKIVPGSMIEIELTGVVLSEAVKYHEGTGMMHLKYAIGDLLACSLPGTARNQYLLSDPKDTLGGRVVAGVNATPGALAGDDESGGSFEIRVDGDDPTRVGFVVRVPYGLLRHLQDPWDSTLPGTFFEPIHLHAEAEMISVWAEPFDREWIVESNEPVEEESGEVEETGG